jgi:hypothetical protein
VKYLIVFCFFCAIFHFSCDEPVGSNISSNNNTYNDTLLNPFLGIWTQVFDTMPDNRFSKEQKKDHWHCHEVNGITECEGFPISFIFEEESTYTSNNSTKEFYWFTEDSIHFQCYANKVYRDYDTFSVTYRISGDTLEFEVEKDIYYAPPILRESSSS